MINLDVPVGLAVDGSASNDGSNLLEELRVCYLLHRLNWSNKAPTGYDILKIATKGSARVLGRKDIGELSVGKAADLFMINSNRIEFIGAQYDPKSILGTVGCKSPVDYTIVAGKIVVKDGKLTTIDEEKTTFEARKAVETLFSKI
jgi:cytosine/adenosine deaminase-related metal-dependent hydrolase